MNGESQSGPGSEGQQGELITRAEVLGVPEGAMPGATVEAFPGEAEIAYAEMAERAADSREVSSAQFNQRTTAIAAEEALPDHPDPQAVIPKGVHGEVTGTLNSPVTTAELQLIQEKERRERVAARTAQLLAEDAEHERLHGPMHAAGAAAVKDALAQGRGGNDQDLPGQTSSAYSQSVVASDPDRVGTTAPPRNMRAIVEEARDSASSARVPDQATGPDPRIAEITHAAHERASRELARGLSADAAQVRADEERLAAAARLATARPGAIQRRPAVAFEQDMVDSASSGSDAQEGRSGSDEEAT